MMQIPSLLIILFAPLLTAIPRIGAMEGFIDSMRRLDVRNIPCGILDTKCVSSPTHLTYLHLQDFSDLPSGDSVYTQHGVKKYIKRVGAWQRFYKRLSPSRKLQAQLIISYAAEAQKAQEIEGIEAIQGVPPATFKHPYNLANWILLGMKKTNDITLNEDVVESRLPYILWSLSNDKKISMPMIPFSTKGRVCDKALVDPLNKLNEKAKKKGLDDIMDRLCSYEPKVLELLSERPSLSRALQPFIEDNPEVALASRHLAAVHRQAIKYDRRNYLKFLQLMPPIDVTSGEADIWKYYERYLEDLKTSLHGKWLQICTGLSDEELKEFHEIAPDLKERIKSVQDCHLRIFGTSTHLGVKGYTQELYKLIDEPYGEMSCPDCQQALFNMGGDKKLAQVGQYRNNLRFLFHFSGKWTKLSGNLVRDINFLSELDTHVKLDLNGEDAEKVAGKMLSCNLSHEHEVRMYLRSLRMGVPMKNCPRPDGWPSPNGADHKKFPTEISPSSALSASNFSLFYELTGIPLLVSMPKSGPELKNIISIENMIKFDPTQVDYLVSLAILTFGEGTSADTETNLLKEIWNDETELKKNGNWFWTQYLTKRKCGDDTALELNRIDLRLVMHLIGGGRLSSMTCENLGQLASKLLLTTGNTDGDREDIINTLTDGITDEAEREGLRQRLSQYSDLLLKELGDIKDSKTNLRQPLFQLFHDIPLYGQLLDLPDFVDKFEALDPLDISAKGGNSFFKLADEYFNSNINKLIEDQPVYAMNLLFMGYINDTKILGGSGFKEFVTEHCKTLGGCFAQWTIYGIPLTLAVTNREDFDKYFTRLLSTVDEVFITEGLGKTWNDFRDKEKTLPAK
jgi:hypothetical protein